MDRKRDRRKTPLDGGPRPFRRVLVAILPRDTGGRYRPVHREQDPAEDPREPGGGESSGAGTDHGWSNCTMASGADVLAYHTAGRLTPWGGDLRHRQGDQSGGTDLYDLRDAWAEYGETLTIKSGAGWSAVVDAHEDGRAIVIQGTGQVPGSGDFDGGHACAIGVETRSSDGAWLWGDPLCSDWQWIAPGKIKSWAQAWSSGVAFAVSKVTAAPPPPEPPPADTTPYDAADLEAARHEAATAATERAERECAALADELVTAWANWLQAPHAEPADNWDAGSWADEDDWLGRAIRTDPCPDPAEPALWNRGPVPYPVRNAVALVAVEAAWDTAGAWRNAAWR